MSWYLIVVEASKNSLMPWRFDHVRGLAFMLVANDSNFVWRNTSCLLGTRNLRDGLIFFLLQPPLIAKAFVEIWTFFTYEFAYHCQLELLSTCHNRNTKLYSVCIVMKVTHNTIVFMNTHTKQRNTPPQES